MVDTPVKPIHEIQEKPSVGSEDRILILDKSTNEARLASKEELRGEQGIQGKQGDPGKDGKNPEYRISETHLQYRLVGDTEWNNLIPLSDIKGLAGNDGSSIQSITRTDGSGASGTTDTYTVLLTNGTATNFQVYNGKDGLGAGDMLAENNLSDLSNKEVARTNLDVYSQAETDTKFSLKTHNHSIGEITDLQTNLDGKANLTGGNVFSGEQRIKEGALCIDNTYDSVIKIHEAGKLRWNIGKIGGETGVNNYGGNFQIRGYDDNGKYLGNYFNINRATGNVGVGTSNPSNKFHIYQNDSDISSSSGLTIEQDGTGDAIVQFLLTGTRRWVMGADNSDSDKFKISPQLDLTNAKFEIDTSGYIGASAMPTSASGNRFWVDTNGFLKRK